MACRSSLEATSNKVKAWNVLPWVTEHLWIPGLDFLHALNWLALTLAGEVGGMLCSYIPIYAGYG